MEIIEEEKKHYELAFDDAAISGSGYSFPCDKDGNIMWSECSSPEATHKSLAFCRANPERWTKQTRNGRVVAIIERQKYGICPQCGHRVYFGGSGWSAYMGMAECDCCGQWYNIFGQALKPPEDLEEPLEAEPDF